MTRQTAFIIAKQGFNIRSETRNLVIDSRRSTFKYLDRSEYQNGVYPVSVSGNSGAVAQLSITIPHTLKYAPSVRVYAAGNIVIPSTGNVSNERIIIQPEWQAGNPYIIATSDASNVYLDVLNGSDISQPNFDILVLVGADNLDSKPDETIIL